MSYICHLESCQAKEMLPFKCQDCNNYFCRKHCAYDKHKCCSISKPYRYKPDTEAILLCSYNGCENDDKFNLCNTCKKQYCEKHQHPWHKCINTKSTNTSWWKKFKSFFQKN